MGFPFESLSPSAINTHTGTYHFTASMKCFNVSVSSEKEVLCLGKKQFTLENHIAFNSETRKKSQAFY